MSDATLADPLATPFLQALLTIPILPSRRPYLLRLRSQPAACQSTRRRTRRRQRAELERARARAPPRRSGMAAVSRGASAPADSADDWGRRSPEPSPGEVVLRAHAVAPPHAQSRRLAEALAAAAAQAGATLAALDPASVGATKRLLLHGRRDLVDTALDRESAAVRALRAARAGD